MDLEQFETLVDLHGAAAEGWPDAQRAEMQAFARTSEQARAVLADARNLDAGLDIEARQIAPLGLAERIVRQTQPADPWADVRSWFARSLWRPAAALLAPFIVGLALGVANPESEVDDTTYLADYPWVDLQEFSDYE